MSYGTPPGHKFTPKAPNAANRTQGAPGHEHITYEGGRSSVNPANSPAPTRNPAPGHEKRTY